MTLSILNDCLKLKDQPSSKMLEYLHSINITIFDKIFNNPQLDFEPKLITLYILCAYSEESPFIIPRQDAKIEQENICEFLQIPEIYRNGLIQLDDKEVRSAVTNFSSQFCGPLLRWLNFAKIQYQYFEKVITNRDFGTKEDEESIFWRYDIKEHGKAIAEMERLAKKIALWERELKQDIKRYEGIKEIEEWKDKGQVKKGSRTGSIEHLVK